jgi:hypothetical protein
LAEQQVEGEKGFNLHKASKQSKVEKKNKPKRKCPRNLEKRYGANMHKRQAKQGPLTCKEIYAKEKFLLAEPNQKNSPTTNLKQ